MCIRDRVRERGGSTTTDADKTLTTTLFPCACPSCAVTHGAVLQLNYLVDTFVNGTIDEYCYDGFNTYTGSPTCKTAFKLGVINNRTAEKVAVKLNENAGQSWASMPEEVHRNCASYFPARDLFRTSRCSAVHRDLYQIAPVHIGLQRFSDNSKLFGLAGAQDKVVVVMMEHKATRSYFFPVSYTHLTLPTNREV